jgi:fatty acid desaturase
VVGQDPVGSRGQHVARTRTPKRKRRLLPLLVPGGLTVAGGGGGWGLYFLIARAMLSSPHSEALTVLAIVLSIVLSMILVIAVFIGIALLVVVVAWVRLFWRAGDKSISTIQSHQEARETFMMVITAPAKAFRPGTEPPTPREDENP